MRRAEVRIDGVVQGVGFRPYVHRLAGELHLAGFVRNDARGVAVEVEGAADDVERFLVRLPAEAPPLARVESVRALELRPVGTQGFVVAASGGGAPAAPVAPDAATCADCLAELFDPADRRYRYPFVNCTNCGPRFTIVRGVPYDRPRTTMAGFAMCAACRAEYDDPADRRFHAQPNACPACGPRARLVDGKGRDVGAGDAVRAAALALAGGRIVAVKGVGGYHLACRADDERAVAGLRARKRRELKPFALMAADLAAVRTLVDLEPAAERALLGVERPIVLAPRRAGASVAASVAPRSADLGVMLPYAPLHHLLLADAGVAIVLTSGNVSDEPIAFRDEDALERLGAIADLLLVHDRPIETRTDDSVVRVARGGVVPLRRSRGFVPSELKLPVAAEGPLLACGAELKGAFCLARGGRAWLGPHVGDLTNAETLASFEAGVRHVARLFDIVPEVAAHDLHPDYLSTGFAQRLDGVRLVGVQHHHAHLAACLAEHGERGPAVGAIFDGTGFGADGTVWGGELLVGGLDGYTRAGHLRPARMPGGDRAVREPWRMACAWLAEALDSDEPELPAVLAGRVEPRAWRAVAGLARSGFSAPLTTSVGRLFDAVAVLCGGPAVAAYEGQAAVELEAACDPLELGTYALPVVDGVLDARPAVRAVVSDVAAGVSRGRVAARFHRGLAAATAEACAAVAARSGLDVVALSGGVFCNRLLLEGVAGELEARGLRVLTHERVPPNDGGIAYGQAAIAAAVAA